MTILALLTACVMPGPFGDPPPPVLLAPPTIAALDVVCTVDAASWTITLEATSWTGGATSWWTLDGAYVEEHGLDTVAYEPDGSAESLRADIAIVADWRLLAPRNTAFTCADAPDVLVSLQDLDGERADCGTAGPAPEVWEDVEGLDPCG